MDPWTAAETVNARTLPLLYGTLLCFTVILLLLRHAPKAPAVAGGRLIRVGGIVLLTLGFVAVLNLLNLWLALGAVILTLALWLGERRYLMIGLLALCVPLAGWLGIEVLLGLHLPD